MFRVKPYLKCERCVVIFLLGFFLISVGMNLYFLMDDKTSSTDDVVLRRSDDSEKSLLLKKMRGSRHSRPGHASEPRGDEVDVSRDDPRQDHMDRSEGSQAESDQDFPKPNYVIHAFYYPWYGNPENDGKYIHWNHKYLQHWDSKIASKWPKGVHTPPEDIGAAFYPQLGPYSSKDPQILQEHMKQIRSAGIGVVSVSWYPPREADGQGEPSDEVLPLLLDVAQKYKVKVCLHIEPFKERSAAKLRDILKYVITQYGHHPAFYHRKHKGKSLPLYYIYDSYQVSKAEWARIFTSRGDLSVRGTDLDGIFIGLLVDSNHRQDITLGGFDGFYTYFASNGFTYGSRFNNWNALSREAEAKNLLFIPSVGPGYNDEKVRPWNALNTKERRNGQTYDKSFAAALSARPPIISITSFNEWHEGTQIENSVPKAHKSQYFDYLPNGPDYYLTLTAKWSSKYQKQRNSEG